MVSLPTLHVIFTGEIPDSEERGGRGVPKLLSLSADKAAFCSEVAVGTCGVCVAAGWCPCELVTVWALQEQSWAVLVLSYGQIGVR